jgi:group I intron endonuclease
VESTLFKNRSRYVINKRFYSTANNNNSININNSNTEINISDRLDSIIKELGLNPVYVLDNLGDGFVSEITRQEVIKHTRGLSGVYMILNKVTKDYYIGSASTNKFYSRFCRHLIYFLGSKVVKSGVKKYGLKNFAFIVLDLFPEIVTQENNKDLLDLEDKYLKLLLPNYNILTEAGSSFGYKHSEIDRQKMKDIYSDVRWEMAGDLNRGKNSQEKRPPTIFRCASNQASLIQRIWKQPERMREAALKRPPMSPETRNKCITNTRPVILYNLNDTVFGKYSSIIEAANAINCGEKSY